MKNIKTFQLLMLITAAALIGCSTKYQVVELPPNAEKGRVVNGVPFRMKQRYKVKLYQLKPEGGGYEQLTEIVQNLPNPDKIYVLRLKGGLFSDSETGFTLNSDGTLSAVNLISTSQRAEVIGALSDQTKAITTAVQAKRETEAADELADTTAIQAEETARQAQEDLLTAALTAKQAVETAQFKLDNPATELTPLEHLQAEQGLKMAKYAANTAYRRAGMNIPYPGIFP